MAHYGLSAAEYDAMTLEFLGVLVDAMGQGDGTVGEGS
jgi:hypothetical protein